ncbi:GntR family transcriptional regulator [Haloactinopolyspora alba]|uniref:GntR family transcriptional regulator n=1 Tax=Haloactinopolyspora alba TaxID=648780 RepID=A0A2P8DFW7_9ACTN|nr:GntR family transcriptional regulator [Haloactinopolyspora alba]
MRLLVLDGRLALETRLPGERDLAHALDVSRTTVTAAYDALRRHGYAASRQGSGTWTTLPASAAGSAGSSWAPFGPDGSDRLDLAHAAPEAPTRALRDVYAAALEQLPRHLPTSGYHLFGLPELRAAIAATFTERGLPTTPEQVLVTAGTQQAFSLVLSAVVDPGDRVLIDHPTYPNAIDALRRASARPVPVPLTSDGWDVDAVAAALRQTAPRLAYLIPDFHNPTGLLADQPTRAALATALTRSRTVTVVDETNVDLALDADVPAPLACHLPGASTVTIGGTSKSIWGGLRVGWARADTQTIRRLAAARATMDISSPVVEQLAAAEALHRRPDLLPATLAELRLRRDALVSALNRQVPQWHVRVPSGGLVLWCDTGLAVSSRLVAAGERYGLRLAAGPRFGVDGAFERRLRLPYTHPVDVLENAAGLVAQAFRTATAMPSAPEPPVDTFA